MSMELTELYFELLQKAAVKANYFHDKYGSWKKVAERAGGVSFNTWNRIAMGSPANTPRIETLVRIAWVETPKKYDIREDLVQLKRTCRHTLCSLAKTYGKEGLAEKLRVSPYLLNRWCSVSSIAYIPEFRYLLAIDYINH